MIMVLLQAMNNSIAANVMMALVDEIMSGAIEGIVIGVLVGAIVMPMVQAPDTMLRAIVAAIFAGLGMSLIQLARIGRATGERLGTILRSFAGPYTGGLGAMILDGIIWVFYAMFAGALIGAVTVVPDKVIKGGLVGLLIGAIVGAGLRVLLSELGYSLNLTVTRIVIAALTWALFTVIIGGDKD
jgi:hypothetical protein